MSRESSEAEIGKKVHDLVINSENHAAFKNPFYETWMAKPLPLAQVEVFARNFYERAQHGPRYIALAFLQMTDLQAMVETAENLMEEMGDGNPEKVHSVLLRQFIEILLSRMADREYKFADITAPVLESTTKLVNEGDVVFKSMSKQEVCGALLAKEWHAYSQLVYLYEGVRNYMSLFTLDEFHEHCEYFYLHIGATEKQHKYNALAAAAEGCQTEQELAELSCGFYAYLDLLAANWQDIYDAMQEAGRA